MILSKGDETSMTATPKPTPDNVNASDRARRRFEVEGNAMYALREFPIK
jgi:hypothetical protein